MVERPDLISIVERLGMRVRGRRAGPCQACGASATKTDPRPPVLLGGQGWRCVSCGESGDALSLAAAALEVPRPLRGAGFRKVLSWVQEGGVGSGKPQAVLPEPERADVSDAIARGVPLQDVRDPALLSWLARRRIRSDAPAMWLPSFTAAWWPRGWSERWPVVVQACSGTGQVLSMQGIAVRSDVKPAKVWPKGVASGGLVFASGAVRQWMAGSAPAPERLVIVEGAPDYLTVAPEVPAIGVYSGSASALSMLRLPKSTKVYIGTHCDPAGQRYEAAVADALSGHPLRRLRLDRVDNVVR